jgi:hypothetical protein
MADFAVPNGTTSNILRVKIHDPASGANTGLPGLTSASAGLIISTACDNEATATVYTAAGSTIDAVATLGTFAAPTAGHCRIKEYDSTNHPGLYELQLADARFAVSSARRLTITIQVTGGAQEDYVVDLSAAAGGSSGMAAIRSGTAQAGASSTITLDAGASATNNLYRDQIIQITGGTGVGQCAAIQSYVGSTKVATIFPAWATTPDNTSTFSLWPASQVDVGNWSNQTVQTDANNLPSVGIDMAQALPSAPTANTVGEALFILDNLAGRIGTAQAGAASSITLDAGASALAGSYVGYDVFLYGGTGGGIRGVGQRRTIVAYNTSTKVATVDRAWSTNPDATTTFILFYAPKVDVWMALGTLATAASAGILDVNAKNLGGTAQTGADVGAATTATAIATAVWGAATASYAAAGSFGLVIGGVVASVWAYTTRILTAGTNIALAKGTGLTGLNDIAATAIVSNGAITTNAGKVSEVTLVDTATTLTNAPPDSSGTTTLLTRLPQALLFDASGFAKASMNAILGTALTESVTGYLAAAFKKLFNVATPTLTADTTGSTFTAIGDTRMANLDAAVSSRMATFSYTTPPTAAAISTQVGSDLATAHGAGSWATATGFATAANQTTILQLLQADLQVDTTTSPWDLVFLVKGSGLIGVGTELLRQKLYDVTGAGITSTTVTPGRQISV